MPRLSLQVLGTLALTMDGEPLAGFKSDKGRGLLIYLAVEADRSHRRERLAGLLWPDYPDRAALARLSDTLSNLRSILRDQAAAAPFLTVTPSVLQFNTQSDHWLDVREFELGTREQGLRRSRPRWPATAVRSWKGSRLRTARGSRSGRC